MPTVTLRLMGHDMDLNPADLKDLSKASNDLKFTYNALKALDQPLSATTDGTLGTFSLDAGNPSWQLAGSPATISLSANVTCTMSFQSKGTIKSYYTDFDNSAQSQVNVSIPADKVYIITEIQFNMTGTVKGQGSIGLIGINGSTDGSVTYTVQNFKAFDPAMRCSDAIEGALAAFTLPLHSATAANLSDGDAIYYEFDGSIDVGFGVTYGVSTSVGGYSSSEINSTFKALGNVASISAPESFTAGANAGLSVKFNWTRRFRCLVLRSVPPGSAGTVTMHLFTGNKSDASVQFSVSGGVSNVTAPQLAIDTSQLTQKALQALTGQTNVPTTSPLQTPLNDVQTEVQKYVTDANNWLSSLAQKANTDGQIQISLLFDNSKSMTSAFTWNFDVAADPAKFQEAWNAAMQGDFVAAYATGAATLDSGSGFEKDFSKSTKFTFTFFGLINFSSVDSYFRKATIRYGGNGIFYLETNTGKLQQTKSNSKGTSTSLYLDGTAKNSTGGTSVSSVDIQLHGVLTCTNDASQMSRLGLLLQSIGVLVPGSDGQQATALGTTFKNFGAQSGATCTGLVHVMFAMSALGRLRADPYFSGKQSRPPHLLDATNWNNYVVASDSVSTDPSSFLAIWLPNSPFYKSYSSWAIFNCLMNGYTDPDGNPTPSIKTDRHSLGNPISSNLHYFSTTLSDEVCNQLVNYFGAGQQYMNLCDDLQTTTNQVNTTDQVDWARITAKLEQIAGRDLDAWYGPTILLALLQSSNATTIDVQQGKIDPSVGSAAVVIGVS